MEHAVGRHDVMVLADDRLPGHPAEQQWVEGTEQPRRRQLRRRSPAGEVDQPLAVRLHLVADRGHPAAGVAEGDPGPLGEVTRVGRETIRN